MRVASLSVEEIGGTTTGTLYFDELHAADARSGVSGAGRIYAAWSRTVTEGTFAGTRLYVSQSVAAQGADFRLAGSAAGGTTGGGDASDDVSNGDDGGDYSSAGAGTGTSGTADFSSGAGGPSLPTASGVVATDTRAGLTAGPFHLEGRVVTRGRDDEGSAGYGHEVAIPLLPGGAVTLRESFFRDYRYGSTGYSRQVGVQSAREGWGTYQVSASHNVSERETQQAWRVDLAPPSIAALRLQLRNDISLFAPDLTVSSLPYGSSWRESTDYLLPVPERLSAQERRLESGISLDIAALELTGDGGWTNRSSLSGEHESRLALGISLPLSFEPAGRRPWKLTPSYSRSYLFIEELRSAGFADDGAAWANRIAGEPGMVTALPIAELFQTLPSPEFDAPLPGGERRSYDAEGSLEFSRVFTSRISDLWIPSAARLDVERSLAWEGDSIEDSRTWRMEATATAVNLFGREGAYPRALLYASDEFRNSVTAKITERPRSDGKPAWSVGASQGTSMYGAGENRLDSLLGVTASRDSFWTVEYYGEVTYRWIDRRYPPLNVLERLEETPYYRHEERTAFTVTTEDGTFKLGEVTAGHRTELIITRQGSISLFGDLGWTMDAGEYENGALHLIGLRIGVEGRLSY